MHVSLRLFTALGRYDATTASFVRLLACDVSGVPSAVPMPLIASVKLPCGSPLSLQQLTLHCTAPRAALEHPTPEAAHRPFGTVQHRCESLVMRENASS